MKLHRVLLENFGLFRGRNEIDLSPSSADQPEAPITLVAGMNGAGKTTLLEAIQLTLYGRAALGKRVSRVDYLEHLRQRIHRRPDDPGSVSSAMVGVVFDHETMGEKFAYRIVRRWSLGTGAVVDEQLTIEKDGEILTEVGEQYWQDFVRELVPPGISQLFFFDGEKIQRLADDEDSELVAESIKSLLGLDLVERLKSDLSLYRERQLKKTGSKQLLARLEELQEELGGLEEQSRLLRDQKADVVSRLDGINRAVEKAEVSLARHGGRFAECREDQKAQRVRSDEQVKVAERKIRELTETALPFAFCGGLSSRLLDQLANEQKAQEQKVVAAWAEGALARVRDVLSTEGIDERVREAVASELQPAREHVDDIHALSAESHRRLQSWFEDAAGVHADTLKTAARELESATRALQESHRKLRQVPEEDALKVHMESLTEAMERRASGEAELKQLDIQLGENQLEQDTLRRELRKVEEKVELDDKRQQQFALLEKCQAALVTYQHRLTLAKVERLGQEVTECFHRLHRKGDLVKEIRIDPVSCRVALYDSNLNQLAKSELSAGEKQMYAVAMLWGLAKTSGRKLPLIIDTPLGRLDSKHRDNLVQRYFPHAAKQVIILSTDTEIDKSYYRSLSDHVARAYRLEFDADDPHTEVREGYFWKEEDLCHA